MFTSTKKQLLPYAIVTLFGLIGFTLPLPILPKMFLDPEHSILPITYSHGYRNFLLGIVMMSFPLGQLIGSPILGRLSDRYGRKPTIIFSLGGNVLGYLLAGIGILSQNISDIFAGLFICGFCEGNIAISQSVVADITMHEPIAKRSILFGWIEMFICIGAIIGPLLGGLLSDSQYVSWFSFATPFWAAAFMTFLGVIVILFCSKETKSFEKKSIHKPLFLFLSCYSITSLKFCTLPTFFTLLPCMRFIDSPRYF
jgi:MFS transporter, DHA1 family, tetracycline resistance protein